MTAGTETAAPVVDDGREYAVALLVRELDLARSGEGYELGPVAEALYDLIAKPLLDRAKEVETGQLLRKHPSNQPAPVHNHHPAIIDLVHADLDVRREQGIAEYGTPLQPFNGRDALRDLYEELLDGAQYARQAMYERDNPDAATSKAGTPNG